VDAQGNVYIAEDRRVRKVNRSGTITTIAGSRNRGFSGDGGPATSAELWLPSGLAVDGQRNLYIADTWNRRVRKVSPAGTITTVAGTGRSGFSGDGGPATQAQLGGPAGGQLQGLALDAQGNLYIVDTANDRVRKVSPSGTITTVAGSVDTPGCNSSFGGDGGPAMSAKLACPAGVAVDAQGFLYVVDRGNHRVREVGGSTPAPAAAPKLTLRAASPQRVLAQNGITITARCDRACSLVAGGSVKIVGTRYSFPLIRATARLSAAGSRKLTLRWSAATQRRFARLRRPGQRAQAVITVRADGTNGRRSSTNLTVVVR
jgi:sugar lactone lactonase YvrE